jgi:O-antigen ligase
LTLLFLFFLLFVLTSTFSITFSQIFLGLSGALFILVAIGQRHQPFVKSLRWFYLAVAFYLGWVIIRSLMCSSPLECLNYAREEWLWIIVPITVYLVRDDRNLDRFALALSVGLIFITVASLVMYGTHTLWGLRSGFSPVTEEFPRMRGLFAHALTFGNYTSTATAFLLGYVVLDRSAGGRWRHVLVAGGVAGIISTLLCNSRGPIIALVAAMVLLVLLLKGRTRWWGVAVLVAALILAAAVPGIRGRFTQEVERNLITEWPGSRIFIWEHSWQVAEDNLLVGIGPGQFADAYEATLTSDVPENRRYTHAHDDLLNTLAVFGLPGLVTFVAMWLAALGYFWFGWRRSGPGDRVGAISAAALLGTVAFAVGGLTEASFVDEELRALLMFIWGVGLAGSYKGYEPGERSQVST